MMTLDSFFLLIGKKDKIIYSINPVDSDILKVVLKKWLSKHKIAYQTHKAKIIKG